MEHPVTQRLQGGAALKLDPVTGEIRSWRYELEVIAGPDEGKRAIVEGTVLVGTHPDVDLVLTDPSVSRHHLELQRCSEGVRVKDVGSTNGTFAAGARLHEVTARELTFYAGNTGLRLRPVETLVPSPEYADASWGPVLGRSAVMRRLFGLFERLAPLDSTVLITGETGTGKRLLAQTLHQMSRRRDRPFIAVDCSTLSEGLVDSELFGHGRGAFTGALQARNGAFLEADGGTLYLERVGELPTAIQPRLLRALETRTISRVGEDRGREVDIRVIASTQRDLEPEVSAGRFRSDLFFRLAVVQATVPPLRERTEDLPGLIAHFMQDTGRPDFPLPPLLLTRLTQHPWPGNVRELRNFVHRAVASENLESFESQSVQPDGFAMATASGTLTTLPFKEAKDRLIDAFTREYVTELLKRTDGNITEAARAAGLARTHFHALVGKLKRDQ